MSATRLGAVDACFVPTVRRGGGARRPTAVDLLVTLPAVLDATRFQAAVDDALSADGGALAFCAGHRAGDEVVVDGPARLRISSAHVSGSTLPGHPANAQLFEALKPVTD